MADQKQSTTDFKLATVQIFALGSDQAYDIRNLVHTFSYVENIASPFVAATLTIADSGGLLNSLPIQGGETVKIAVETNGSEEPTEYVLSVYKIGNRYAKNQMQSYTLGLVSIEALNNEYFRVHRKLSNKVDGIIADILKTDLKTDKTLYSETTLHQVSIIPPNRRPFDVIGSLAIKSVPANSTVSSTSTSGTNNSGKETVKGTAGFFFWENKRGYNFFSVDSLLSGDPVKNADGKVQYDVKPWGPYVEKIVNVNDVSEDRFTIMDATFNAEIDLLNAMRRGRYSASMSFFNHSTGQYKPYHYSVDEVYDQMKHLGSQNRPSLLKVGNDKTMADYPTRVMSFVLDHETWYNDPGPASHEPQDGATSSGQFTDRQAEYAAQSIVRYELLQNQVGTIIIPGNNQICAGDKIDIKLTNKLATADMVDEQYDPETSGVYLIQEITHTYDTTVSSNGRFTTTLRLMRDSYGDIESKRGTK